MTSRLKSSEEVFVEIIEGLSFEENMFESRSREGIFTPALTMWLMMQQRANGGRGLSDVVEALSSGEWQNIWERNKKSKRIRVTEISINTSAYSQARSRLSLEMARKVSVAISERAAEQRKKSWHGKSIYLCDGTTLGLGSTQEILRDYKPTRNQHGTAYAPDMQCIFCHELWSGSAMNAQFAAYRGPKAKSEQQLCIGILDQLPKESLLIADRNFGIFAIAHEAERRKIETLVRLSKSRAKSLGGSSFLSVKDVDIAVSWKFGLSQIPGLKIPEGAIVQGRFIKHILKRKGFRDLELYFFTTSRESAHELVELYAQRERIENDIRSLKYVVGMEILQGKTPEMLEKELLLGVAAYNLVRATVAIAAKELAIEPRKISFSKAARITQIYGNQLYTATNQSTKTKIIERFIKGLGQSKLPNRSKLRIEPRKLAREPSGYPRMKKSRVQERKEAKQILKEHGHRGYFTTVTRDY